MVENLPSNSRDMGLIPGQGTKILHAVGQLSPRSAAQTQRRQNKCLFLNASKDFPGNPVVKTPHFQCRGPRFSPWLGD